MLRSSGLWSMVAAGLVLMWGAAACAQSTAASKRLSTNAVSQPSARPAAGSYLVCDSSGHICAGGSKRQTSPAAVAASTRSTVQPAAKSPLLAAPTPTLTKPQLAATSPGTVICDAFGRACTSGSAQPISAPSPLPSHASRASTRISAGNIVPTTKIDGISAYGDLESEDSFTWALHAYKSRHRLEVYFKGHLYRTYHAVFGRNPVPGAKLWEGDRRTPEGSYLIVAKHRSARFGWFLHINYPNEQDHLRFEEGRAAHLIPASAREGGQIGIHGTDSPYLNVSDINWTTGCISVDNADIGELARILPVGTLVIINR